MDEASKGFGDLTNLLRAAGIIDPQYPVKGCYVWLPDGFQFKEHVFDGVKEAVRSLGYEQYQFPRLIPGSAIRKVTAGVADFENGIFWLRRKDGEPLDVFLNPTGECGVYTMFKQWVRHESDLPLRLFQIGTTFRPHRRPDVLLNGDELTNLLEAHSAFSSKSSADEEFLRVSEMLGQVHIDMGLPFLQLRRPIHGNKPVCTDMISFETFLPSKGTSFNVGVLYNQGQIYSRAFGVEFSDQAGRRENTHQVTFGISERGIAAMLDLHRDGLGLRMLPEVAPTQILVIPVYDGESNHIVDASVLKVKDILSSGYRVREDHSNRRPGKVLAEARQRGIPIRIGVSPQDAERNTVRVYLRTQNEPEQDIPLTELQSRIPDYFSRIRAAIVHDAAQDFRSKVVGAETLKGIQETVQAGLIAQFYWCQRLVCLEAMERQLPGEMIGTNVDTAEKGGCIICGDASPSPAYYARRGASP